MRTPTRLPTPYASPSRHCVNASANRGSSPRFPGSVTASTPRRAPDLRGQIVDRPPGLSVRLKLTLSYAGFLMVAGALLLATVWVFLLRYVPNSPAFGGPAPLLLRGPSRHDLLDAFAPRAAEMSAFRLFFGVLGVGFLAGGRLA